MADFQEESWERDETKANTVHKMNVRVSVDQRKSQRILLKNNIPSVSHKEPPSIIESSDFIDDIKDDSQNNLSKERNSSMIRTDIKV